MEYTGPSPASKSFANATFSCTEDCVLAADTGANNVLLWDSRTGLPGRPLSQPHHAPITCVVASPVDRTIFTGGEDFRGKYWDVPS
jgi:WD40 repeat protein